MTAEELRRAQRARPFRPFRLHLSDGREIPVRHPELFIVGAQDRIVIVYIPGEGTEIIDIPLVTAISRRRKRPSA